MCVTVCLCLAYVFMCVQLHVPMYAARDQKRALGTLLCHSPAMYSFEARLTEPGACVFSARLEDSTPQRSSVSTHYRAEVTGSGTTRTLWVLESGLWSSCTSRKYP